MLTRLSPASLGRLLCRHHNGLGRSGHSHRRGLLSPAFQCTEAWDARLQEPKVQEITKPVAEFFELKRKYKAESRVFGLDVDRLLHRLSPNGDGYNVGDILYLLRSYQETRFIDSRLAPEDTDDHQSTPHQALRLLLESGDYEALMEVLSRPMIYGTLPCDYTTCLLIDHFLESGDYTRAARVASRQMLGSRCLYPSSPSATPALTPPGPPQAPPSALGLLAVHLASHAAVEASRHIPSEGDHPWKDYEEKPELWDKSKPMPEMVRLEFRDNPFYDDHFHVRDGQKIIGKTLDWASQLDFLGSERFRINMRVKGCAMWQNWDELISALGAQQACKAELSKDTLAKVEEMLEKDDRIIEGTAQWAIQENVLNYPVWYKDNFYLLADLPEEGRKELMKTSEEKRAEIKDVLKGVEGTVYDMKGESEEVVRGMVDRVEGAAVEEQLKNFQVWSKKRQDRYEYWLREEARRAELGQVEQELEALQLRQQQLRYFDSEQLIQLQLSQRGQYQHPYARASQQKKKRAAAAASAEDDYVPPDVSAKRTQAFAKPSRANVVNN